MGEKISGFHKARFIIPCTAAETAERLRHNWLKHQLCYRSSDNVVLLWKRGSWQELEHEYPSRLETLKELVQNLEYGFSPFQLVERLGAFQNLPPEMRTIVASAVHSAHLELFPAVTISGKLEKLTLLLKNAIEAMRGTWRLERDERSEDNIRSAWEGVRRTATSVLRCMRDLPRGVILP